MDVALLLIGSRLVRGKPKSKGGERLAAGAAWDNSERLFTTETGEALNPDWISRRFKEMTAEAGLYQHVSVQMQIGAAEMVVALLPGRKKRETGS